MRLHKTTRNAMPPIRILPDPAPLRSVVQRSILRLLLLSIALLIASTASSAQTPRPGKARFLKARGGLSVADAWIAATARLHRATLVHKDEEFATLRELQQEALGG